MASLAITQFSIWFYTYRTLHSPPQPCAAWVAAPAVATSSLFVIIGSVKANIVFKSQAAYAGAKAAGPAVSIAEVVGVLVLPVLLVRRW